MDKRIITAAITVAIAVAGVAVTLAGSNHDHPGESNDNHAVAAKDDHHNHGDHGDEVTLTEVAIRQNGIRVGVAESRNLLSSIAVSARVSYDADAVAHVGSLVSGRAIEIKAKLGDKVRQGDELIVVESPELGRAQSEFLQRRTEAEVAAAAVTPSKDAYTRAKQLFDESQGISYTEVQKREAEFRAVTGTAATAKAALQAAEHALSLYGLTKNAVKALVDSREITPRFSIRAPMDGQIVAREVTLGELVSPDKEKLLVIANTEKLWVWADVPENRLDDVGIGSKVAIQIASRPGEHIDGDVSLVSPEIDTNTRTARIRIVLRNDDGKLRPGMFARATIRGRLGSDGETAVAVPEEAVQTVEGKPSVFVPVEGEPNTFARREVAVSRPVNGFFAVHSGLKAGEPVVLSGSFILKAELGKSEAGHEH